MDAESQNREFGMANSSLHHNESLRNSSDRTDRAVRVLTVAAKRSQEDQGTSLVTLRLRCLQVEIFVKSRGKRTSSVCSSKIIRPLGAP